MNYPRSMLGSSFYMVRELIKLPQVGYSHKTKDFCHVGLVGFFDEKELLYESAKKKKNALINKVFFFSRIIAALFFRKLA